MFVISKKTVFIVGIESIDWLTKRQLRSANRQHKLSGTILFLLKPTIYICARCLIGSRIKETAAYCNQILLAQLYLNITQNTPIKVILLSGGHSDLLTWCAHSATIKVI